MIALHEHDAYNEHQTLHLFSSMTVAARYVAKEHKLTDQERIEIVESQTACIAPKKGSINNLDGELVDWDHVDDQMDDAILYETLHINDHRK